jgi:hypothetical protein
MFIIIIINRQCHSINNLLLCDLCITSIFYNILSFIGSVYGLRGDWYDYQPLCIFRAYLLVVFVTSAGYSFLIQSISRLFFSMFYTHRFLLSWYTHWILIIVKWLISFLLSIEPFFIENGYLLIEEYRMCGITKDILSVSLYIIIISFLFPGSIVIIVYSIIVYQARQLTRRIIPIKNEGSISIPVSLPYAKRNSEMMKSILIILNILILGGIPYLILSFWNIIEYESVPKELYFLSINMLTLSSTTMMIVLFFMNKTVKDIAFKYILKH